jgi:hypothetical protein
LILATTSFVEWTTAIAAVLSATAAGAAVWVSIVQPRWRRPELSVPKPKLHRELVTADLNTGIPSAWVRVAVHAKSGRDAAEEVEVSILEVRQGRPDGTFAASDQDPMLAGLPLALSSSQGKSSANVPAGGFRIFDVASTYEKQEAGRVPLVVEVAQYAKPADKRNELYWDEVEIDLAITAKNADSRRYRIRIAFDGQWDTDIWKHVKVDALEPF